MKTINHIFQAICLSGFIFQVACPVPWVHGLPSAFDRTYSFATTCGVGGGGRMLVRAHIGHEPTLDLIQEFGEANFEAEIINSEGSKRREHHVRIRQDGYACCVVLGNDGVIEGACYEGDQQISGAVRVSRFPWVGEECISWRDHDTSSDAWHFGIPSRELFDANLEEVSRRWRIRYNENARNKFMGDAAQVRHQDPS